MVNGADQRSQGSFCHFPQGPQMSTMLQGSHCHTHINGRKSGGVDSCWCSPFLKRRKVWLRSSSVHFLFYLVGQDASLSMELAQGHFGGGSCHVLPHSSPHLHCGVTRMLPSPLSGDLGTAECRANLGDYSFQEAIDKKCPPGLCF